MKKIKRAMCPCLRSGQMKNVVQYLISGLPGEVHVVDIDRYCWHSLLCFPEVVCEWGHFALGHY